MASFDAHIAQARSNLSFLERINQKVDNCLDWQVTTSFYVCVHLVNAYLASKANLHYRSHDDVTNALNPAKTTSICRVDEESFIAYRTLQNLSRRSRYLINDKLTDRSDEAHYVSDKYLYKSLKNLNVWITKIESEFAVRFGSLEMKSHKLQQNPLPHFVCVI